jgi:archaeosortase B (VPXXXP-CTERM-specific)
VPAAAARRAPPPHAVPPRRAMLRFGIAFGAIAAVLFAVYQWTEATGRFRAVNVANGAACAAVLRLCGVPATRSATTVEVGGGRGGMEIISECSAIYVLILFAAAVLAFPTTWSARARGLALGLPLLLVINIVRLVTLGLIVRHRPAWLPLFHEYLWQVFFVVVVVALYLVWIERMVPRARAHPAA